MKKHIYYFDYLRIFAAIGVIYMHVAANLLRGEINLDWHISNALTSLAFTAVPLFFMMSGFLILSDEKTLDVKVLLKKRLPHLLIPLVLYTVIAVVWKLFTQDALSIRAVCSGLVSALSAPAWVHFWYMYTLIAIYCISPILCAALRNLDKNGHMFIFCIIILIFAKSVLQIFVPARFVSIDVIDKLSFFGGHLASFMLGYYLGNLKRKIPNVLLLLLALMTLAAIVLGTVHLTLKNGAYTQAFQSQTSGFEVFLASCIFLLAKQLCDREIKPINSLPLIPLSLGIYLSHNLIISFLRFYEYIPEITTLWQTVWITFAVALISYLATKTLATIKPLCFPITGLTFSTACKSCNWVFTFKKLFARRTP